MGPEDGSLHKEVLPSYLRSAPNVGELKKKSLSKCEDPTPSRLNERARKGLRIVSERHDSSVLKSFAFW
jgi:hypothetical protein